MQRLSAALVTALLPLTARRMHADVKWYGEASIVDQWLPKVLEILVPSAKLAAVTE